MEKSVYDNLDISICEKLIEKFPELAQDPAIRRNSGHDKANPWRPAFVRDVEKIMNIPYYNRYTDKTQVFSFYKNDDISRRALHVQLVSRIARNIGRMLGLNLDLIEAIALGHDIGHTPFGHAGERFLNELYHEHTGRFFNHNVHSVRVLDKIFPVNISLQTLDGILCHNGRFKPGEYYPCEISGFDEFDRKVEECYIDESAIKRLVPSTLEGCVVRLCDMIAYVGKDRQDAVKAQIIPSEDVFERKGRAAFNAAIINNMTVNIVENSYGKKCLCMDDEHYDTLKSLKRDNFTIIYNNRKTSQKYDDIIKPLFKRVYEKLLEDLNEENMNSPVYKHHIELIANKYRNKDYVGTESNQIVTDYIASMTDDYFVDLCGYMFPDIDGLEYIPYFTDL